MHRTSWFTPLESPAACSGDEARPASRSEAGDIIPFRANTGFNAPLAPLEIFSNGVNEPPRWKVEDFLTGFTSQDPLQIPYTSEEPIVIEIKKGVFTITPLAEYKLSGMVVSKKSYSDDWDGRISPVDLAIVWSLLVFLGSDLFLDMEGTA